MENMIASNRRVVEYGWYLPPETQQMKRAQGARIAVKLSDGRVYVRNVQCSCEYVDVVAFLNWFIPRANEDLDHGANPFGLLWKVIDTVEF